MAAKDQYRPIAVNSRETPFNPLTYRISVNAKKLGDFLHCINAMDLDESIVRAAFSHGIDLAP